MTGAATFPVSQTGRVERLELAGKVAVLQPHQPAAKATVTISAAPTAKGYLLSAAWRAPVPHVSVTASQPNG
jgi:hypothetical protein